MSRSTRERSRLTKERENDERISPAVSVRYVQWLEELVADFVLTVLASRRGVGIVEVPTDGVDEVTGPVLTRLTRGRVELDELVRLAHNFQSAIRKSPVSARNPKRI